jgi:hypothetical protein
MVRYLYKQFWEIYIEIFSNFLSPFRDFTLLFHLNFHHLYVLEGIYLENYFFIQK